MAHIHEKIDFTVSIYIVFGNKVLFHKHKLLGIWLPPGGHIEPDEDPNQAAIREAKEETGLDVALVGEAKAYNSPYHARDLIMPRFINRHYFDKTHTHEHVDMAFFARADNANARHEIEGGEIEWLSADELTDPAYNILPDVEAHARAALDQLAQQ